MHMSNYPQSKNIILKPESTQAVHKKNDRMQNMFEVLVYKFEKK